MRRTMITVLLVAGLLAISAIGSQSLAQNMLANPGFEDLSGSYDGWFTFGSGPNISTAADDNIMRTGDAASKIYGEFSLCDIGGSAFDVGGYGQTFTHLSQGRSTSSADTRSYRARTRSPERTTATSTAAL